MQFTEPILKEDWTQSELLLPFAGFYKSTHPNVCTTEIPFYSLCLRILQFVQEYKQAVDILRKAYFQDTSNIEAIKQGNIALLSDLNFGYGIIKAVTLQAKANNKDAEANNRRNTFMSR